MGEMNWGLTDRDEVLMGFIVARAVDDGLLKAALGRTPRRSEIQSLAMDLRAAHLNGCPLRLADLLDAPEPHFGHDILGIRRFMHRTPGPMQGKLGGYFRLRFAKPARRRRRCVRPPE